MGRLAITLQPGVTVALWGPGLARRVLSAADLPRLGAPAAIRDDAGAVVGTVEEVRAHKPGMDAPMWRFDLPEAYRLIRSDASKKLQGRMGR